MHDRAFNFSFGNQAWVMDESARHLACRASYPGQFKDSVILMKEERILRTSQMNRVHGSFITSIQYPVDTGVTLRDRYCNVRETCARNLSLNMGISKS